MYRNDTRRKGKHCCREWLRSSDYAAKDSRIFVLISKRNEASRRPVQYSFVHVVQRCSLGCTRATILMMFALRRIDTHSSMGELHYPPFATAGKAGGALKSPCKYIGGRLGFTTCAANRPSLSDVHRCSSFLPITAMTKASGTAE